MEVITEANFLLGVDLRHLVALEAVASNRSFARAAKQLGYTQSAVSQQIAALERAVGARLLERPRGRNLVEPTEAGELLLRHAERIVASLRAAKADLSALAEGTTGSLRIGTFQSIGMSILPTLLSRFRTAWPDVEVTLVESVFSSELLEQVERGDLDLTFEALPLEDGPFEVSELMRDPYVLLVPRGSPCARRGARVTLERRPAKRARSRACAQAGRCSRACRRVRHGALLSRAAAPRRRSPRSAAPRTRSPARGRPRDSRTPSAPGPGAAWRR